MSLENFHFNTHILNEYAKEEEEEEEEKKKTTDWPTFHSILQRKSGEYFIFISFTYLVIVSGFNNARGFIIFMGGFR